MGVAEQAKRLVWLRAGGRCVLCKREVLDETMAPVFVGDVAHVAGQGDGPGTPRLVADMPAKDRDRVDNLLLLCQACHRKVDDKAIETVYDLETLYALKQEHEYTVRHLLSLMESSRTLVLRMIGNVRGNTVSAGPARGCGGHCRPGSRPRLSRRSSPRRVRDRPDRRG
jgi:hypothetical protein